MKIKRDWIKEYDWEDLERRREEPEKPELQPQEQEREDEEDAEIERPEESTESGKNPEKSEEEPPEEGDNGDNREEDPPSNLSGDTSPAEAEPAGVDGGEEAGEHDDTAERTEIPSTPAGKTGEEEEMSEVEEAKEEAEESRDGEQSTDVNSEKSEEPFLENPPTSLQEQEAEGEEREKEEGKGRMEDEVGNSCSGESSSDGDRDEDCEACEDYEGEDYESHCGNTSCEDEDEEYYGSDFCTSYEDDEEGFCEDEDDEYAGDIERHSLYDHGETLSERALQTRLMQIIEMLVMEEGIIDETLHDRWDAEKLMMRRFTGDHLYDCMHGERLGDVYVCLDFSGSCLPYAEFYKEILSACEKLGFVKIFDTSNGFGLTTSSDLWEAYSTYSWHNREHASGGSGQDSKNMLNLRSIISKMSAGKGITPKELRTLFDFFGSGVELTYCFTDDKYYAFDHFLSCDRPILLFGDFDGGFSYCVLSSYAENRVVWFSSEERYQDLYEHSWCRRLSLSDFRGIYIPDITKENALTKSVNVLRGLLKGGARIKKRRKRNYGIMKRRW